MRWIGWLTVSSLGFGVVGGRRIVAQGTDIHPAVRYPNSDRRPGSLLDKSFVLEFANVTFDALNCPRVTK
jgi:hypothetical protein